jgi:diaminohydroxyphosphoribosylaminopyrimidine deaminase/5-amino-6-(5-phosphoribosylamino)uracil reductase
MDHRIAENRLSEAIRHACAEARKYLGATSPNPAVGAAALDAEGNILAVAAHHRTGEAHAEAALLELCRAQNIMLQLHTLCVTLEPCNHQGHTPPCTETILQSGIKHLAIGTRDPNPNVAGGGIEKLRQAGIDVAEGIDEEECRQLIAPFSYSVQTGKPWITIKRAFDKNGSAIPPPGQKTFTSPESLKLSHQLRKKADAIIAGSGTILTDDPLFTVRYVPDFPDKHRWLAIIDRRRRVPDEYIAAATERGFNVEVYETIEMALEDLAKKGARDVLVEAGPLLSEAMFDYQLWCMSVTVRQGDPDRIEVEFNSREPMPFTTDKFRWEWFVPS